MKDVLLWIGWFLLLGLRSFGQPTYGEVSGVVYGEESIPLAGANVVLLHRPSGARMSTFTNERGAFFMAGVHPGNGYTIRATHLQGKPAQINGVLIRLGETTELQLYIQENSHRLPSVTVTSGVSQSTNANTLSTWLTASQINRFASGSKNLQDVLRMMPEAQIDIGGTGSVSVAGENYRYNALYTDGVVSHDLFGISASGTFGGITGSSPISLEAMEACKVVFSATDAMQGNFTGAAIQTITKKGSNHSETTAYHYWQNAALAGRTLHEIDNGRHPSKFQASTRGMSARGAFEKNRLFFFCNIEQQEKQIPIFQSLETYTGRSVSQSLLPIIRNQLIAIHGYDPGDYKEAMESLIAKKILLRIDAHLSHNRQLIVSGRYYNALQTKPGKADIQEINFSNSGFVVQSENYTLQFEWRKINSRNFSHQWLGNITHADDRRMAAGNPFPRIKIMDQNSSIYLGTDMYSGINSVQQDIAAVKKQYQWMFRNHIIRSSAELTYARFQQRFVPAAFGYAIYSQPADFILQRAPVYYRIGFQPPELVNTAFGGATQFSNGDLTIAVSDQLNIHPKWVVWVGFHLQKTSLLEKPPANEKVNLEVLPVYANYRSLLGAQTNQPPIFRWSFAPKIAIRWRLHPKWKIETAFGLQAGRLPMVWPGAMYVNQGYNMLAREMNAINLRGFRLSKLQYPTAGGILAVEKANAIPLNLVAAQLNLPLHARLHAQVMYTGKQWNGYLSAMVTRNLYESAFTQLNSQLPDKISAMPGARKVYPTELNGKIPLDGNGNNPYDHAILLHSIRQSGAGGLLLKAGGNWHIGNHWQLEAAYAYTHTKSFRDATGSQLISAWQQTPHINGRNEPALTLSDFSRPHKWVVGLHTENNKNRGNAGWLFSINWIAQSGAPYSFVYEGKSLVRDDGTNGYNELIYIPTAAEIPSMSFLPFYNGRRPISSPEQAAFFENWIQANPYLAKHRGQFATRNGSHLPISIQCDIKWQWEQIIGWGTQKIKIIFSLECFNLMALINRESGRKWEIPNNRMVGPEFLGYRDENTLEPIFQFDPDAAGFGNRQEVAGYNHTRLSRWIIQPGIKITLN
jgi:hypothetical protein